MTSVNLIDVYKTFDGAKYIVERFKRPLTVCLLTK